MKSDLFPDPHIPRPAPLAQGKFHIFVGTSACGLVNVIFSMFSYCEEEVPAGGPINGRCSHKALTQNDV